MWQKLKCRLGIHLHRVATFNVKATVTGGIVFGSGPESYLIVDVRPCCGHTKVSAILSKEL